MSVSAIRSVGPLRRFLWRGHLFPVSGLDSLPLSFASFASLLAKYSPRRPLGLSLKYVSPLGAVTPARIVLAIEASLKHSPAAGDPPGSPTHSHGVARSVVCGLRATSAPQKKFNRGFETPPPPGGRRLTQPLVFLRTRCTVGPMPNVVCITDAAPYL